MNSKKFALFLLAIIVVIGTIVGIDYYQEQNDKELMLYGNVDVRTVNLSFRVAGKLAALQVDEGDAITAGQALGQLDNAPFINALNQAKATRDAAKANLAKTEAGYRKEEIAQVRAETTQKESAFRFADSFLKRQQGLWQRKMIADNELDNAKTGQHQALAAYQAAKDKLRQFEAGYRKEEIAAAKAQLAQAEAAVAQAELNSQDTQLTSPSAGVILTRAIEPGTMLAAGNTVFTLSLTNPVWIRAYIDEPNLNQAIAGREIQIYTDGRKNQPYHGKIGFVSPTAEFTPKNVETPDLRTDLVYRLRIIVNDPDEGLKQGMPVTLRFTDSNK
ncbi:secretion protein HlyD [Xenorhabdus bovienii]|uniref:Putative multidrug resistance membrane protein n=2 Tax=Xenorhabdus bovienii TaxID=40576 RepID=A0A077PJ78_XENBV|nr:secretion protein HlyD [Xenorhabdus bovienii]MDE1495597.1 secretion protein HlyD [Xenorhabdus bovienii]MDE9454929.1 secretion protein HlyD [Xenorhabdus bovienii]MDE9473700.1 secretion protein HlyD [Xenorhabdus bovienii]MDE9482321.1 secretion protein HlyD [Xenorhabdus bovienii]MDE9543294.1 secretion protein HlyD [Xenorhabdus bovienii]